MTCLGARGYHKISQFFILDLSISFLPNHPVQLYRCISDHRFETKQQLLISVFFTPTLFFLSFFSLSKTRRKIHIQVIGGELQERLIPVPYSKNSTDQAVRAINKLNFFKQKKSFSFVLPFLSFRVILSFFVVVVIKRNRLNSSSSVLQTTNATAQFIFYIQH